MVRVNVIIFLLMAAIFGQVAPSLRALKGKVLPDFPLKTLDGKTIPFSRYQGKVILLNFWSPY